jgi:hypothetical protein
MGIDGTFSSRGCDLSPAHLTTVNLSIHWQLMKELAFHSQLMKELAFHSQLMKELAFYSQLMKELAFYSQLMKELAFHSQLIWPEKFQNKANWFVIRLLQECKPGLSELTTEAVGNKNCGLTTERCG